MFTSSCINDDKRLRDVWNSLSVVTKAMDLARSSMPVDEFMDEVRRDHYTEQDISCLAAFVLFAPYSVENMSKLKALCDYANLKIRGAFLDQLSSSSEAVCHEVLSFCALEQSSTHTWEDNVSVIIKHDNSFLLQSYLRRYPATKDQQVLAVQLCIIKNAKKCFKVCEHFIKRRSYFIPLAILCQSAAFSLLVGEGKISDHMGRKVLKMMRRWGPQRKANLYRNHKSVEPYTPYRLTTRVDILLLHVLQQQQKSCVSQWLWDVLSPHLSPIVRCRMEDAGLFPPHIQQRKRIQKALQKNAKNKCHTGALHVLRRM